MPIVPPTKSNVNQKVLNASLDPMMLAPLRAQVASGIRQASALRTRNGLAMGSLGEARLVRLR